LTSFRARDFAQLVCGKQSRTRHPSGSRLKSLQNNTELPPFRSGFPSFVFIHLCTFSALPSLPFSAPSAICYCNKVIVFSRILSVMSFEIEPMNDAFLVFQSRLFNWSASTTPVTLPLSGRGTSNGYPLTWLVTGQHSANPTRPLYNLGDKTMAGRLPACSWPAWGFISIHTRSPRSGI